MPLAVDPSHPSGLSLHFSPIPLLGPIPRYFDLLLHGRSVGAPVLLGGGLWVLERRFYPPPPLQR